MHQSKLTSICATLRNSLVLEWHLWGGRQAWVLRSPNKVKMNVGACSVFGVDDETRLQLVLLHLSRPAFPLSGHKESQSKPEVGKGGTWDWRTCVSQVCKPSTQKAEDHKPRPGLGGHSEPLSQNKSQNLPGWKWPTASQRGCFLEKGWSCWPLAVFGVACVQVSWGTLVMLREPGKGIFLLGDELHSLKEQGLSWHPMLEQIQLGVSQGLGTFITMTLEYTQRPKELTYWSPPPPKKRNCSAHRLHSGSWVKRIPGSGGLG